MRQASTAARAWGLVAALCITSACASPYRQAIRAAREAEDLGNDKNALVAYREACSLRRPGHATCVRAEALTETLAARAVASAEAVCMQGHVDRCTDALARVAGPAIDHPDVGALIARGMDAAVQWDARAIEAVDACVAEPPGDVAGLLAILECLEAAREPPLERPAFIERIDEHGPRLSLPLLALAAQAPPGGRHALAAAAVCVDGFGPARQRMDDARAAFLAVSSRPIEIQLAWSGGDGAPQGPGEICRSVASELVGVVCATGEDPLVLEIDVRESDPVLATHESVEAVRYQSGVRFDPNPDYEAAERRLARAEYALDESEPVHHEWQAACASAERQHRQASLCHDCPEREDRRYYCERADQAKSVYERHADEVQKARTALNRTPATLEIAEYDVHRYTERHYRWTVDYALSLASPSLPGRPMTTADRIVHQSSERPAFAAANVTRRVRQDPGVGQFGMEIVRRLLPQAVALAREARRAEAPDPDVACNQLDLAEWLDCRATTALASGRVLAPAETMGLIARRLGVGDVLLRCPQS